MKLAPAFALALLCASGAGRAGIPMRTHSLAYEPAEAAWAEGVGTSAIDGVATWNPQGRYPCRSVSLIPKSSYADESILVFYGNTEAARLRATQVRGAFREVDPRYIASFRRSECTNKGNFAFDGLPAGTYYVTVDFIADTLTNVGRLRANRQEYVFKRVQVAEGERALVDLSNH